MAENTGAEPPNHLNTSIEPGTFDNEKSNDTNVPTDTEKSKPPAADEEEDEDMDALIDELESQDGHAEEDEEEEDTAGTGRVIPEDQLQTDTRTGLTEQEVLVRRKKYGMNQMKEEKENLILKFLGYFIGPIQFVMEVCTYLHSQLLQMADSISFQQGAILTSTNRQLLFLQQVSKIGSISVSSVLCFSSMPPSVSSKNFKPVLLWTN